MQVIYIISFLAAGFVSLMGSGFGAALVAKEASNSFTWFSSISRPRLLRSSMWCKQFLRIDPTEEEEALMQHSMRLKPIAENFMTLAL